MKKLVDMVSKENIEPTGTPFDRLQQKIFTALAEYQLEMQNSIIIKETPNANK